MTRELNFWYEFSSPYSYISAMRIEELTRGKGIVVNWQPFLLGPIFKAKGWDTSPFTLDRNKGKYMLTDVRRLCKWYGLPEFTMPDPFPPGSLMAARAAISIPDMDQRARFSKQVFQQEFCSQKDIASEENIREWLGMAGLNADEIIQQLQTDGVKDRLKANVKKAMDLGIFGAPSFMVGDELFWGDDRLEQAISRINTG